MARLSHPNVVTIYEVGMLEARVYIAMEYVRGVTMKRWMRSKLRPWQRGPQRVLRLRGGAQRGTAPGWCTATSSRTTCCSAVTVGSGCWTSVSLGAGRGSHKSANLGSRVS